MRRSLIRTKSAAVITSVMLAACGSTQSSLVRFGPERPATRVPGLRPCRSGGPNVVDLDPDRPLTVLVHGCNSSGGRFRTLAEVFEAHGQQTVCFDYDDRDRIEAASAQLIAALDALQAGLRSRDITVLGHSQGGLVARRALVGDRAEPLGTDDGTTYRLVTISSPFAGIRASSDCGKTWLHVLSLGVTVGICQAIAGDKWTEIHPRSEAVNRPGTLGAQVDSFVLIVTDERNTCRRWGEHGRCEEDDFVFSVAEQLHAPVQSDARATASEVKAGHVEIVGEPGVSPTKLIATLQKRGILEPTPPERREQIVRLLAQLY